jgi:hypothetical protein
MCRGGGRTVVLVLTMAGRKKCSDCQRIVAYSY